jgi:hypothetical protein
MELATTRQITDPPASSVTIKAILTRSRILRTRPRSVSTPIDGAFGSTSAA